ncbi:hypothetical protein B0T22DRAFT_505000 [Podospora appendiculata]|uniref:DUF7918 domain-containing protein n=1 Tax=Podospora appendiculata TaxID=314037 RepID=A0AAE0XH37_9PEZI|nr:hypothetical protein B0T22DRAFT_505000 [Podospora appendiculata]
MAVIDAVPGLSATIEIEGDGLRTREYDDSSGAPVGYPCPAVVKYIRALPGARFTFHFSKTPPVFQQEGHHIAYILTIDGQSLTTVHEVGKGDLPTYHSPWESYTGYYCTGSADTGYRQHDFKFAKRELSDANSMSQEEQDRQFVTAKDQGVLKIDFFSMKPIQEEHVLDYQAGILKPKKHTEEALKGKEVDCVATATTKHYTSRSTPKIPIDDFHHYHQQPFAVFEFRYRSRDALVKEGIIPPPSIDDMVNDMTVPELREMAREHSRMKQAKSEPVSKRTKLVYIKREPIDDDEKGSILSGFSKRKRRLPRALRFDKTLGHAVFRAASDEELEADDDPLSEQPSLLDRGVQPQGE